MTLHIVATNTPEFCALNQSVTETGNDDCGGISHRVSTLSRTAETKIELVAGGLAPSGASRLVLLKASADEYPSFDVEYWDPAPADFAWTPFYGGGSIPLPVSALLINGQPLIATATNANVGETLIALPAGGTQDIALTAYPTNQNHYSFNVQAQDVQLHILANGIDLSTNTPEFCVGQQVIFTAQFDPPIDYSNIVAHWHLPDKYVNETNQSFLLESPYPTVYDINQDLLTNLTTSCWYVNGTGGTVSIGMDLLLPDGHSIPVAAKGNFTVYRPTLSNFQALDNGFTWNSPTLQGQMDWSTTINSKYDGFIGVTQLLNANGGVYDTDGEDFLDGNTEIYGEPNETNGLGEIYVTNNIATHTTIFDDNPSSVAAPCVNMVANFKDYIRFKPGVAGDTNIWITLGTNGWTMDGQACLVIGTSYTNLPPASTPINTDEFPEWVGVRHE